MPDPTTVNRALFIPTRGSDPGTWDVPMNSNFSAIDTLLGGVTTVSASSGTIVLNSSQLANGTIIVTGNLTGNTFIQFPNVQGWWTIANQTSGFFNSLFALANGGVNGIGIPPGEFIDIQVNGNIIYYRNLDRVGNISIMANRATVPGWISGSTIPPYLLCDGSIYNFSTYPILGGILVNTFGGNGTSTFGVPDLRGRIPLSYAGTSGRITAGGSGLSGTTLGAALDQEIITLTQGQMPSHYHAASIYDPMHTHGSNATSASFNFFAAGGNPAVNGGSPATINAAATGVRVNSSNGLDTTYSAGGGSFHNNVQPSLITGITVIRAA